MRHSFKCDSFRSNRTFPWPAGQSLARQKVCPCGFFVEAELALYRELRPDLVLLDNRPTGRTSAEKAGIPAVAVLNVHMSNYRRVPFSSPENLFHSDAVPGVAGWNRLENGVERLLWDRLVMGGLNRLRRRMGLKSRYAYEHEEGDLSLLADIPEFNPVRALPPWAHYIGPLTWHNDLPAPRCLERLRPDRPTIYWSLGSTSLQELFRDVLPRLARNLQVVVATGEDRPPDLDVPDNVFLESFVNTDMLLPRCDLVCCHGGNGTLYQALAHGLPVVAVATHEEQYYGGKRIRNLGLGRTLTLKELSRGGVNLLTESLHHVLNTPDYRTRARAFSRHFAVWNGAELAANAMEQWWTAGIPMHMPTLSFLRVAASR